MSEDSIAPPGRAFDHSLGAIVAERPLLLNLAYRMLGSAADAEDVVQDTYVRWFAMSEQRQEEILNPTAWLVRVASRGCLDILGSARVRRERYVGDWITEPMPGSWSIGAPEESVTDPADRVPLDETVSIPSLDVLESLTPAEQVSLIPHDVFRYPNKEISHIVGQSVRRDQHIAIVRAYKDACQDGDIHSLITLLDPSATVVADGGGKVRVPLRPISGAEKVARFFLGLPGKQPHVEIVERDVNGQPGLVAQLDGVTVAVIAADVAKGLITHLWIVMNPDKIHLRT